MVYHLLVGQQVFLIFYCWVEMWKVKPTLLEPQVLYEVRGSKADWKEEKRKWQETSELGP